MKKLYKMVGHLIKNKKKNIKNLKGIQMRNVNGFCAKVNTVMRVHTAPHFKSMTNQTSASLS